VIRTFWSVDLDRDYRIPDGDGRRTSTETEANCISSLLTNGKHAPLLDHDCKHEYVPSSTPGHGNLYLDVELTWRQYRRLLKALRRAGVLEKGYVGAALKRKHNELRLPHVKKPATPSA
jgi:hypothetical protein